jgi:hypothetical protein
VPFNLAGASVPGQVIWSLSFSTTGYPAGHTTGFAGPDNSLNIQLAEGLPEVGSNPLPGTVYLDASNGSSYNDNGAFRPDSGWSPYGTGAIEFTGPSEVAPTPEPSSPVLFATGLFGLAVIILGKGRARGAGVKP